MSKEQQIWKPVNFHDSWTKCNISKLDDIAPSWYKKRENLKTGSFEYENFLTRLKRQHAIETGIIEKLYDLKEGITETFIKEGFVESYLQHGDTNISQSQLLGYLNDQFEAIDFVFDFVKSHRFLSKSFMRELHQLLTRHQENCEAIDTLGNRVCVPLLKGAFKTQENNPVREDGNKFMYCPPVQVESEIDSLLSQYNSAENEGISPIILTAWFHHAFTTIHPFQDGNGRMARLLSSLILVRAGLFPFTVRRNDKVAYIKGLEAADLGDPQPTVSFFCEAQRRSIQTALNLPLDDAIAGATMIDDVVGVLSEKVNGWKKKKLEQHELVVSKRRTEIFSFCNLVLENLFEELNSKISPEVAHLSFDKCMPDEDRHYYFSRQIVSYAKKHDYYFNRAYPRGWFRFKFIPDEERQYQIIITLHHYGYDDSSFAIGAFIQYAETTSQKHDEDEKELSLIPLDIAPHVISLENEPKGLEANVSSFLNDAMTLSLSHIASEFQ